MLLLDVVLKVLLNVAVSQGASASLLSDFSSV